MKHHARKRFSEKLEAFQGIIDKEPQITLHGTHKLSIDIHGTILEYTDERIHVDTPSSIIAIHGRDLSITVLTKQCLEIQGKILSIEVGEEK